MLGASIAGTISAMASFIKGGYREMNSVYIQVCLVTELTL